jgi:hypothetical protein
MDPINTNDLVYVYRGCKFCDSDKCIGRIFKVLGIVTRTSYMTCCGQEIYGDTAFFQEGNDEGFMTYCLRKIPPIPPEELLEDDFVDKPIETVPSC